MARPTSIPVTEAMSAPATITPSLIFESDRRINGRAPGSAMITGVGASGEDLGGRSDAETVPVTPSTAFGSDVMSDSSCVGWVSRRLVGSFSLMTFSSNSGSQSAGPSCDGPSARLRNCPELRPRFPSADPRTTGAADCGCRDTSGDPVSVRAGWNAPDARYWELCSADEGPVPQMVNTPTRTAWVLGVAAAVMASPLRVRTKTSSSFNTPSVTKGREATVFCPGAWAGALIPEAVGEMAAPATPLPAPRESATANVALATAARRAVDQREPRPARRRSEEPAASASASSPRRSVDVAAPLGRRMSTSGSGHCLVGAILHTRCVGESNSG